MALSAATESALFALSFLALLIASVSSARSFLFVAGFVVPLMCPRLNVAVGIDWYKVIGPVALVFLVLRRLRGFRTFSVPLRGLLLLVGYSVVVSGVWMMLEYNVLQRYRVAEAMGLGGGEGQTLYKMPVQLGSFLGQLLCAYIVPAWATTQREARAGVAGLVAGCLASVLVGLAGMALFGVGTMNMTLERALFVVGDTDFSRLGGLTGEPKLLGTCLALVTTYYLCQLLFGRRAELAGARLGFVVFTAALFLTFSTSAWVASAGGWAVAFTVAAVRWKGSRVGSIVLIAFTGVVLVMSVGVVADLLETRFFGRVFGQASELRTQKDAYVLDVFRDNPWDALLGYGLGGGDFALIPYVDWLHAQYRRTPTPAITGMRMWLDLGIVGVAVTVVLAVAWARRLFRLNAPASGAFVLAGLTAMLLSSIIGVSCYFFLCGALLTIAELAARAPAPASVKRAMRSAAPPHGARPVPSLLGSR